MNASAAYHQPFQPSGGTASIPAKDGRSLLDLLRARDRLLAKTSDGDDEHLGFDDDDGANGTLHGAASHEEVLQVEHELTSRLNALAASIRRRGLFATASRAQQFYQRANERSSATSKHSAADTGKKRKRTKGGANSSASGISAAAYGIHLDSHGGSFAGLSGGEDLDEGLIVTAVCRILGVSVGKTSAEGTSTTSRGSGGLLCAALDVLRALFDHAKDGSLSGDAIGASVEGDVIGSIASPLLEALCDNVLYLHHTHAPEAVTALVGCFKACASVVSVVETRLSRSNRTTKGARDAAWLVLNHLHELSGNQEMVGDVQHAATALLATLPLAGNSDGAPPAKLWSQAVSDAVTLLRWAIDDFFPLPGMDGTKGDQTAHPPDVRKEHEAWLALAKEASSKDEALDLGNDPTDGHRARALRCRIRCLSGYIRSLLQMEGYPLHRAGLSSSTLDLPLDALLDVSEILLSFPMAAEATHRATKPRLRSSLVKNGLLSPTAAVEVSPDLRMCGHDVLDVTVASCRGGAGALSRARRLVGMAVANLQSSCSVALVSTVDGRRGGDGVSRRGMWLRGSVPLRIRSIRTFRAVVLSLGAGVMASTGTAKSIARALVLVGGCLLEQVSAGPTEGGEEWGTMGDRAKLVELASDTLSPCIAAFGGLIPNDVRGTLDSIVHTCLSTLHARGGGSIFAYSHVKRSVLQLGMNCACAPWGDGGRSTLVELVRKVSATLRHDPDASVASTALSTLCVLDAFATPRAPPILIPTRGSAEVTVGSSKSGFTASSLLQGMNESKVEMAATEEAKKKKSAKKSGKKSNKKAKKEESKARPKAPSSVKEVPTTAAKSDELAGGITAGEHADASGDFGEEDPAKSVVEKADEAPATYDTPKHGSNSVSMEAAEPACNAEVQLGEISSPIEMRVDQTSNLRDSAETASEGKKDAEMKEESNSDVGSDLDDFPDIVDEEPDEEDRL